MHDSARFGLEWSGTKGQVTETCDVQSAHLVTHVKPDQAMRPDMTCTAEIPERLAAKGRLPAEPVVDAGQVDAALLVASRRDHGIALEGPVRAITTRRPEAEQAYCAPS